jgi:Domain of unknown function (DUF4082)
MRKLIIGVVLALLWCNPLLATSLFPYDPTPGNVSTYDTNPNPAITVGVQFTTSVPGSVSGIRFYKGSLNTGTHVGSLWSSTGTQLATVTFTNETASGWQQANFSTPVTITAGTTYVASYHTTVGYYSSDANYFNTSYYNGMYLTAPSSGSTSNGNGLYIYTATDAFPTGNYSATNYWVDLVFNPTNPSRSMGPILSRMIQSQIPINGACGSDNGGSYLTTPPYAGLCAASTTPSTVTGSGPWNWSCSGFNGGSTASCSAQVLTLTQTGLLPPDRDASANWKMAGLQSIGGIPNRTTICATLSPIGGGADDVPQIDAAIANCPAGQVVSLTAGTFIVPEGEYIWFGNSVTMRGAGAGNTILHRPTSGQCPVPPGYGTTVGCYPGGVGTQPSVLVLMSSYPIYQGPTLSSCALTADVAKGDMTATVTSSCASNFHAGDIVILDELSNHTLMQDTEFPQAQVWASPDYRVTYHIHSPSQPGDDGAAIQCNYVVSCDRITNEHKQIASVSGNTITFDSPIMISYRVSHVADLWSYSTPMLKQAGLEGVTAEYSDNGVLQMQWCAYCWFENVEVRYYIGAGVEFNSSFRSQLEHAYIHEAAFPQPGGGAYAIDQQFDTSEILIENSISVLSDKVIVARGSGSGSVIAYSYFDMEYIYGDCCWVEIGLNASHFVGPHHILFEGNWAPNMDSDTTHGNSIYITYFRNWSTGIRSEFVGLDGSTYNDAANNCGTAGYSGSPLRMVAAQAYSIWFSFIGNILGTPNCTTQANGFPYTNIYGGPQNSDGVFLLGWETASGNGVPDVQTATIYPALPPLVNGVIYNTCLVSNTNCATILDGNYNYWDDAITWASNDTSHTLPNSLFLTSAPPYFSGLTWPWVDAVNGVTYTLPAKARYDAGNPNGP